MEINYIKKSLLKSKVQALFSHYSNGNLYYNVEVGDGTNSEDGIYQFPIATVEVEEDVLIDELDNEQLVSNLILAKDLGITNFYREMRGSELNRWIEKAVKTDNFVKLS